MDTTILTKWLKSMLPVMTQVDIMTPKLGDNNHSLCVVFSPKIHSPHSSWNFRHTQSEGHFTKYLTGAL